MIAFYRTMESKEHHRTESASSLSTHPDTGDRIAALTRLAGPLPLHPVALLPERIGNESAPSAIIVRRRPILSTRPVRLTEISRTRPLWYNLSPP
jgi:hypothetical protein